VTEVFRYKAALGHAIMTRPLRRRIVPLNAENLSRPAIISPSRGD
jgi:hypothetical protein